ncbi:unnamed protein product, partial [Symbiodinium microadriaticum]
CGEESESVTDLRKHSGLMPNIGSVKSSEAHPQSAVALQGKQLLDSLRHECPRSTGTADTAACHRGFLEGHGLQPQTHPQLLSKIHGQVLPNMDGGLWLEAGDPSGQAFAGAAAASADMPEKPT